MLSTGAMIRIGKTYENYMIDVRLLNEKLVDRGCRIVAEIANISYKEASHFLNESQQNVKTACVMAIKKCTLPEAKKLLDSAEGILRKVING